MQWRRVRTVIGDAVSAGSSTTAGNDAASIRIEYRPLPTRPTVRDTVGMKALTVGFLRGLVETSSPPLPWAAAERSLYAVVEDGLDAAPAWVTAAGDRTDAPAVVHDEVFRFARTASEASASAGTASTPRFSDRSAVDGPDGAGRVEEGAGRGRGRRRRVVRRRRLRDAAGVRRASDRDPFAAWI